MGRSRVSKGLLAISISTAMFFVAQSITASVIARYSRYLGISLQGVGLIWSTTFIISMALRPLAGELGDRKSSFLPMALGSLLISLADLTFILSGAFRSLILGRVLMGFASSFFISTSIAAATLVVPPESSGKALAFRATFVSLGMFIGPPVGGVIVDHFGYRWAFLVSLGIALLVSFLSFSMHPREKRKKKKERIPWKEAINLTVIFGLLIMFFAGSYFSSFQALLQANYKDLGLPSSYYGIVMACSFGISTVVRLGVSKIIRKDIRQCALLGALGYGIMVLSAALLYFWYLPPYSYLIGAILGIGTGFTVPSVQNVISLATRPEVRNRALSIYAMGFDGGSFFGPLLLLSLAQKYGYTYSYFMTKFFPIVSVILCLYIARLYWHRLS